MELDLESVVGPVAGSPWGDAAPAIPLGTPMRTADPRTERERLLAQGIRQELSSCVDTVGANIAMALESLPPGSPAETHLRRIERSVARAGLLADRLHACASIAPGEIRILDLSAAVAAGVPQIERLLPPNVTLECTLTEGLPHVVGDPTQLAQLALDLVDRAAASLDGDHGVITLTTGSAACVAVERGPAPALGAAPYVFLDVVDDGRGIDPLVGDQVFDPYGEALGGTSGLAMAAAHAIARNHGGCIHADGEPGLGSRVRVCLPAAARAGT